MSRAAPPEEKEAVRGWTAPKTENSRAGYDGASQSASPIVYLSLTDWQRDLIAPLAIEAGQKSQNVLFIAVAVPYWSSDQVEAVWEFQVVRIPSKIGHKVRKLIKEATK